MITTQEYMRVKLALSEQKLLLKRTLLALAMQAGGTLFVPHVMLDGRETITIIYDDEKLGWWVRAGREGEYVPDPA